jgi:ectoine hydroxylase-related dioxygenase (phytanoyl-CoA dioxygenase family)
MNTTLSETAAMEPSTPTALERTRDPDRRALLEQGYHIVRGLIPPEQLTRLRAAYELAVERHRAKRPEHWETVAQPRVHLDEGVIDEANADAVAFWCSDRMLDIASRLLAVSDPGVQRMMMMCNPSTDRGPATWHRDTQPTAFAPLRISVDDVRENGPRRVQWNIPLYDDAVLWVVPGSQLRLNTAEEARQLADDPCVPLPGAVRVELRAGDAVAYNNLILHWGSDYSSRMRRTIHGGHSLLAYNEEDAPFLSYLDQRSRRRFERWALRTRCNQDLTELALRCAIHGDGRGYASALNALQPGIGDAGRLSLSCLLSKTVWRIRMRRSPEAAVPDAIRTLAIQGQIMQMALSVGDRFTIAEIEALLRRFAWLDARLRGSRPCKVAGFQGGETDYLFDDPAEPIAFRDLVASWR